jgi:general secretion pathway protein C
MLEALPDLLTRHRLARPLALATIALLIALLLVTLARTIWLVVGASSAAPASANPAAGTAAGTAAPAVPLANWHLFGNAAPQIDPRSVAPNETSLDLTLRGVFAGDDPSLGIAIIGEPNGAERQYAVGAALPGGATLDSVHPDHVVLLRGAVRESLRLRRPEDGSASPAPAPAGTSRVPAVSVALPGATSAPAPFIGTIAPAAGMDWTAATAKLGLNPAELAQQVSVLPVIEGGAFVGVRLQGGANVPALARLGLKPDDVVTAINGIPLDSPTRAQQVAHSLSQATTATVTVRRNGKSQDLGVSLR